MSPQGEVPVGAKVWFAAHGITHIHRIVTDNSACHRSNDVARIVGHCTRHQNTKPYTPRHNGKAERYQRIMTEELLYAREYAGEDERSQAIAIWNVHYNYHRPHSAASGQPPASRLKTRVTNVRPSYSYADNADDMQLVTFEKPGHFIADDQPAAVVDDALKLFRARQCQWFAERSEMMSRYRRRVPS